MTKETETSAYFVGLDFGSTTSSCLLAKGQFFQDSRTGRVHLREVNPVFQSDTVFTPYQTENPQNIDEAKLEALIEYWFNSMNMPSMTLAGGGAILTGLAAQSHNVGILMQKIKMRTSDAMIVTARDPHFESWLAWHGGAAVLSKQYPTHSVINLDIGGGTTNLAVGYAGEVTHTGSIFVGARHIQFVPGTYCLHHISPYGVLAFKYLHISKKIGDILNKLEIRALTQFYVEVLQAIARGDQTFFFDRALTGLIDAGWKSFDTVVDGPVMLTVTGGVGELIIKHAAEGSWPSTTFFGDLGIDLAKALADSELASSIHMHAPTQTGAATLYGIALFSTQFTGSTVFMSDNIQLPLDQVPILAYFQGLTSVNQLQEILLQAKRWSSPVGIYLNLPKPSWQEIKNLGEALSSFLREWDALSPPLVLLVPHNIGHVLGCYATCWKKYPIKLLVLDEIALQNARFVQIGTPRLQAFPVTFYGFESFSTKER